jgi:hypothetical protein
MIYNLIAPIIVLLLFVLIILIAGCAPRIEPPEVTAVIDCPAPPQEIRQQAIPLPRIPTPAADAQEAARAYAGVITVTDGMYASLADKHSRAIRWGEEHCNW